MEAATYASARGLDPHALIPAAEAWIAVLRRNVHEVADAVASGHHPSDQATVDTYLEAARAWQDEVASSGVRSPLIAAVERNLEVASDQGHGQLGLSARSIATGHDDLPSR